MLASKTLFAFIVLAMLAYNVAGHDSCGYTYNSYYDAKTPEECAAECASYEGSYGECFAWTVPFPGYGPCILFFVDPEASHGEGDYCGLNPVPSVNNSTDSGDEAPGSEPGLAGCFISTSTIDLGHALTKESCELACLGLKSTSYSACLIWFWDEHHKECDGILVRDSDSNACGTPPVLPL